MTICHNTLHSHPAAFASREMIAESRQHDNCSHSFLIQAIVNDQLEIVNYLLANGVSATAKDKLSGLTPLAAAAANGHEEIVRSLLQRDDVTKQWAFEAFKEDIRRDIGGQIFPSQTPRALAFKNGHFALVHILSWRWAELPLNPLISSIFEALNLDPYGIEPTRISTTTNRMAAAYYVQLGIKPGERAFAGRYVMKGDPAFFSFGPGVVKRRLRELRSPESFVKSWQVPVFGKRLRSYSV